jgi:hypothetical protein
VDEQHKVELHDLYSSPNLIRRIKPRRKTEVEHVTREWEKKCACCVFVGKSEKQRPLGGLMDRL